LQIITGNEDGVNTVAMGILYSFTTPWVFQFHPSDCGWIGEVGQDPATGDKEWQGKKLESATGF